jgi:hypothetical protein
MGGWSREPASMSGRRQSYERWGAVNRRQDAGAFVKVAPRAEFVADLDKGRRAR